MNPNCFCNWTLDPGQLNTIAVTAEELGGNNYLIDHAKKATMDGFGREDNIITNFVKRNMSFDVTALLALSVQWRYALIISMTAKGNTILIRWWAGILVCSKFDNDHFIGFPPSWPKISDLLFLVVLLYQFLRWAFSFTIFWAGRQRCRTLDFGILWLVGEATELSFLLHAT